MTKKRKKRISNSALRNIVNTQSTTLVTKDAGGSRCRRGIWGPLVLSFLFPPLRPLSLQHSPVLKHHLFFLPKLLFFTPKINQKKEMRSGVSFLSFSSNSSALTLSRCNPYEGQQQAKESSSRTNRVWTTRAVVVHKVRPSSHILHERSKP